MPVVATGERRFTELQLGKPIVGAVLVRLATDKPSCERNTLFYQGESSVVHRLRDVRRETVHVDNVPRVLAGEQVGKRQALHWIWSEGRQVLKELPVREVLWRSLFSIWERKP